jgi:hypothetical protein
VAQTYVIRVFTVGHGSARMNNISAVSEDIVANHLSESIEVPVPALANARPYCDPCGGPLKVIVKSQKRTNVLVY